MFKEMRRKNKQLTMDETFELLENCEYGVLSTVGENGYSYGVPLDYAYKDNCIYFHCATEGHKLENIEFNNNVSFCVVNNVEQIPDDFNTKYRSVIAFGKAEEVFQDEKRKALILLLEKYSKDFMESGAKYMESMWDKTKVVKIKIHHMTAKGKK